ncbi:caspase family protein, partial [Sphingomonas sp. CCH9-H8]|uniref:caspase family protein n=1 Tax=Sphingomonas sp. CCH9-H8 TaxID=1768772 RepID=UPI0018D20458
MAALSVHIGLNRVSPAHYGSEQRLRGAVPDARAMKAIADAQGFASTLLLDDAATVLAVSRAVSQAAARLGAGDTFFLSYAGHGSQLFDGGGDEPDSVDETLCLFDRMLLDDEVHGLLARFEAGVRVLVITDSCHSATATRLMTKPDKDEFAKGGVGPTYPEADDLRFRNIEEHVARDIYAANAARYDEARLLALPQRSASWRCA